MSAVIVEVFHHFPEELHIGPLLLLDKLVHFWILL
jgi:hypothetical protein